MSHEDCLFCGIVEGTIPSVRVAEDERTVSFMDINPATEGHVLVIPRAHSKDLLEIAPEDLAACAVAAQQMAGRAVDVLGASGVNLLNCCGASAWQTVYHFHFHVVPRYDDDRDQLTLPWIPTPGDPDQIAETGARLRGDEA
ncbi:HIT family protein [Nocardioides sp. GXZ039]|uniref:HIT family protein n=1 Tax=Nocardioides sp. GXZ039 TaxID=3136018 RepID=UPI0030F37ED5